MLSKGKIKALGLSDNKPGQYLAARYQGIIAGVSNAQQYQERITQSLDKLINGIANGEFLNNGVNYAQYELEAGRALTDGEKNRLLNGFLERQREVQKEWVDYVSGGGYSKEIQFLVLRSVTAELALQIEGQWVFPSLGGDSERLPAPPSPAVVGAVAGRLEMPGANQRVSQMLVEESQRVEELSRTQRESQVSLATGGQSVTWVKFPSKANDPDNFSKNVQDLTALALRSGEFGNDTWCTGIGAARGQLNEGDFWVAVDDNRRPRVAVRLEGNKRICEIRGILEGQNLEPEFAPAATDLVKGQGFAGGRKFVQDAKIKGYLMQFEKGDLTLPQLRKVLRKGGEKDLVKHLLDYRSPGYSQRSLVQPGTKIFDFCREHDILMTMEHVDAEYTKQDYARVIHIPITGKAETSIFRAMEQCKDQGVTSDFLRKFIDERVDLIDTSLFFSLMFERGTKADLEYLLAVKPLTEVVNPFRQHKGFDVKPEFAEIFIRVLKDEKNWNACGNVCLSAINWVKHNRSPEAEAAVIKMINDRKTKYPEDRLAMMTKHAAEGKLDAVSKELILRSNFNLKVQDEIIDLYFSDPSPEVLEMCIPRELMPDRERVQALQGILKHKQVTPALADEIGGMLGEHVYDCHPESDAVRMHILRKAIAEGKDLSTVEMFQSYQLPEEFVLKALNHDVNADSFIRVVGEWVLGGMPLARSLAREKCKTIGAAQYLIKGIEDDSPAKQASFLRNLDADCTQDDAMVFLHGLSYDSVGKWMTREHAEILVEKFGEDYPSKIIDVCSHTPETTKALEEFIMTGKDGDESFRLLELYCCEHCSTETRDEILKRVGHKLDSLDLLTIANSKSKESKNHFWSQLKREGSAEKRRIFCERIATYAFCHADNASQDLCYDIASDTRVAKESRFLCAKNLKEEFHDRFLKETPDLEFKVSLVSPLTSRESLKTIIAEVKTTTEDKRDLFAGIVVHNIVEGIAKNPRGYDAGEFAELVECAGESFDNSILRKWQFNADRLTDAHTPFVEALAGKYTNDSLFSTHGNCKFTPEQVGIILNGEFESMDKTFCCAVPRRPEYARAVWAVVKDVDDSKKNTRYAVSWLCEQKLPAEIRDSPEFIKKMFWEEQDWIFKASMFVKNYSEDTSVEVKELFGEQIARRSTPQEYLELNEWLDFGVGHLLGQPGLMKVYESDNIALRPLVREELKNHGVDIPMTDLVEGNIDRVGKQDVLQIEEMSDSHVVVGVRDGTPHAGRSATLSIEDGNVSVEVDKLRDAARLAQIMQISFKEDDDVAAARLAQNIDRLIPGFRGKIAEQQVSERVACAV